MLAILCLAAAVVLAARGASRAADDLRADANLQYRLTETMVDKSKTEDWFFSQKYRLGLSKDLTSRLNLAGNLDVGETESRRKGKSTTVVPDLLASLDNEFFDAKAGYRIIEKDMGFLSLVADGEPQKATSRSLSLASKLRDYPRLRLRYTEDRYADYLEVHEVDSRQTNLTGSADYEYKFLSGGVTMGRGEMRDYAGDVQRSTDTQDGRLNFSKSFLDNRVNSGGGTSFSKSATTTTTSDKDDVLLSQKLAQNGLYASKQPPAGSPLPVEDKLIDGDRDTSAGINIGGAGNTGRHIGLDLLYPARVEKIHISVQDVDFVPGAFTWSVYSGDDNVNWALVSAAAPFVYDINRHMFDLTIPSTTARYFKVVNTANDSTVNPIWVTELEAFSQRTQAAFTTDRNTSLTKTGQFGVGYRATDWMSLRYDVSENRQRSEPDSVDTRRNTHTSGVRLERDLLDWLAAAAQHQRRWETDSKADDKFSDISLVNFSSNPLETVDTDLSFSSTVTRKGTDRQTRTDTGLFHLAAELRKGADLDADLNLTRFVNLTARSKTLSKSFDTALRLALTRTVTAELQHNTEWSVTEPSRGSGLQGLDTYRKLALYWRPVPVFYLRGAYGVERDEMDGSEKVRQEYNLNWLLTKKIQLNTGLNLERSFVPQTTTMHRTVFTSELTWNLSETATLGFNGDFSRQDTDFVTEVRSIGMDLTLKF
ncbi:MAG: hypothetical protein AB1916_02955 [Thermodesulfobacteriota bacterium]